MRQRCESILFVCIILFFFLGKVFAGGGVYWQENGIRVCSYISGGAENVYVGKESAIIVWYDGRNIDADDDIFGQRIDIDGNFLWQVDGVPVAITPGPLLPPGGVIGDGKGGAITSWVDGRQWWLTGGDIYAQRVDSLGNTLWGVSGTAVCEADSEQGSVGIVCDGEGGAIIVWEDGRNGYTNLDIYAQRIDSSGNIIWISSGVPVCSTNGPQYRPQIASDGFNGAVITWEDWRTGNGQVFAQRISSGSVEINLGLLKRR